MEDMVYDMAYVDKKIKQVKNGFYALQLFSIIATFLVVYFMTSRLRKLELSVVEYVICLVFWVAVQWEFFCYSQHTKKDLIEQWAIEKSRAN